MTYSEGFKKAAVQKVLNRGSVSKQSIADEIGVSPLSLHLWCNKYSIMGSMKTSDRRPQDWSPEEKMNAVLEYEKLTVEQQGEFLRKRGLHSDHLAEWKKLWLQALDSKKNVSTSRSELTEAHRKIKELEKELNRKDKALAETSALLILKKKADLIWGLGENE
jgi:transposase-like protein